MTRDEAMACGYAEGFSLGYRRALSDMYKLRALAAWAVYARLLAFWTNRLAPWAELATDEPSAAIEPPAMMAAATMGRQEGRPLADNCRAERVGATLASGY